MRDAFSQDALPGLSTENLTKYDLLFTKITLFLKKVVFLQQQGKQIENHDIGDYITSQTSVSQTIKKIESFKCSHPSKFSDPNNVGFFSVYFHSAGKELLRGVFFKIGQQSLSCGGIMTLDLITDMLKDYTGQLELKIKISILLIGVILIFIAKNLIYTQCEWISSRWRANTIITLQYLIFTKQLKAQVLVGKAESQQTDNPNFFQENQEQSNNHNNEADKKIDEQQSPDVMNLMSVDIEKQVGLFWSCTESIANILFIAIVLSILYSKLGKTIFSCFFILIGVVVFNIINDTLIIYFSNTQMNIKDKRVALSKDVIEGMKSIKYLGWENIFKGKIEAIRSKELKYSCLARWLCGISSTIWNSTNYFLLYFFLVGYVDEGNDLRSSNVFTIIALFAILAEFLIILPKCFNDILRAIVSYYRIKKYLNEKEVDQIKGLEETKENFNFEEASSGRFFSNNSQQTFQSTSAPVKTQKLALKIKSMKFMWPTITNNKNKSRMKVSKELKKPNVDLSDRQNLNERSIELSTINNVKQEAFQLKINDLQIIQGGLSVVIGKIGSGKSALLNAILNELDGQSFYEQEESALLQDDQTIESQENKIFLNGSTAYVSQNHWLQNKSVRENILFGEEFDEVWYDTVVEAADLKVDFETFVNGDLKVIGPSGGKLSGGQKQRVAIGRALYSKKDIYLLDDIFSSLDAHVAEKIFKTAILDLLLKRFKKTVILVTSHYGILKDMSNIQQIIFLEKGSIITDQMLIDRFIKSELTEEQEEEKNKRDQEMNLLIQEDFENQSDDKPIKNYDVSELYALQDSQTQHKEISMKQVKSFQINKQVVVQIIDYLQLRKIMCMMFLVQIADNNILLQHQEDQDDNEDDEEREQGEIKKETFKVYFQSMGKGFLIMFLISNSIMQISQMSTDFWLKEQTTQASIFFEGINDYFGSFQGTFKFLIFLSILITIVRAIFHSICSILSGKRLFDKFNKSLIFSRMKFYDSNPVGRIVNRLSNDIVTIDDTLPWMLDVFFKNLAYSLGYPLGVMIQFPYLIVFAGVTIALIILVQKLYRVSNREVKRLHSVNEGKVLSIIGEACQGVIQIRSFNQQQFVLKDYLSKLHQSMSTYLLMEAINLWMTIRNLLISNILFACVALLCAFLLIFDFSFDVSAISMCLTYSMLLSEKFTELMWFFCELEQNIISVERVRQYLDNEQEYPDLLPNKEQLKTQFNYDDNQNLLENQENETSSQFSIEFKNVYITYDECEGDKLTKESSEVQFALKDVSLQIKKGEKVAICGRTGSGKTSILNALFGMYPIQFGSIFVHGTNIAHYSMRQLREQMSIIPQFGFLYNETLLHNLDPEESLPKAVVQAKINETNLHIRNTIKSPSPTHPSDIKHEKSSVCVDIPQQGENLDFVIENGGENLSNGEKQIVNFLRVILRETDIICLDEASSNMDPQTDALLHEQIFKFSQNKTLLVITHRLENIDLFDRVVVMEKGTIVECGPVKELRQTKGGFFNKLTKKLN